MGAGGARGLLQVAAEVVPACLVTVQAHLQMVLAGLGKVPVGCYQQQVECQGAHGCLYGSFHRGLYRCLHCPWHQL